MKCKQNATNIGYEGNLTKAEKSIIETILNPENRMKSVSDICKIAKVDRSTYYRAFQKHEFVETYKKLSENLIKQFIAPVINAFIREAQRGSFQHGKVLLEMVGLYNKKDEDGAKTINIIHSIPRPPKEIDS